jgi:hypothetical protein
MVQSDFHSSGACEHILLSFRCADGLEFNAAAMLNRGPSEDLIEAN